MKAKAYLGRDITDAEWYCIISKLPRSEEDSRRSRWIRKRNAINTLNGRRLKEEESYTECSCTSTDHITVLVTVLEHYVTATCTNKKSTVCCNWSILQLTKSTQKHLSNIFHFIIRMQSFHIRAQFFFFVTPAISQQQEFVYSHKTSLQEFYSHATTLISVDQW